MAGFNIITFSIALIGGILPTLLWIWYWWRQDAGEREPLGLLTLTYLGGMITVFLILPLGAVIKSFFTDPIAIITAYATIEEVAKLLLVVLIAFTTRYVDKPTDYVVYITTGALGFAALENALFLIEPATSLDFGLYLVTGNLRFLGATVLHTVCGALIGIMLALAYHSSLMSKIFHAFIGLGLAIVLHSLFNYFIMKETVSGIATAFSGIWFISIIIIIIFNRVKYLDYHQQRI